ncbi:MAG: hypothetical protein KGZ71_02880 [Desulfobulbaceae bacterium]|nr:hypothetical protein [Desulfobulbaceae bacterium]
MKYLLIIAIIFSVALNSCEETVSDVTLPYVEQLVIRAVIGPGQGIKYITVERTLPPLEEYVKDNAIVSDAKLTISDGTNDYELTYDGAYYGNDDILVEVGKTYYLRAEWKGKIATAQTTIPERVELDDIYYEIVESEYEYENFKYKEVIVYSEFAPKPGAVYQTAYFDQGKSLFYSYDIYSYNNRNSEGKIRSEFLRFSYDVSMSEEFIENYIKEYIFFLYSYDEQYYSYFNSRHNGSSNSGIFGSDGLNVQWNVHGNGIGLFIGQASTMKRY